MPELVCYDYQVFIDDGQANNLKLKDANDAEVYCILTVPENVAEMTINLRAPVIINKKEKLGKQIVLAEGKYQTRHNVLAEMQRSAFNQKKQKEKLKKTV